MEVWVAAIGLAACLIGGITLLRKKDAPRSRKLIGGMLLLLAAASLCYLLLALLFLGGID